MHELGNPYSGQALVGAILKQYAKLPLYNWPYWNVSIAMPSFADFTDIEVVCSANCVRAGPLGFCTENDPSIKGCVM